MSHFLTLPNLGNANLPVSLCWPSPRATSPLARMSALVARIIIILGWPLSDRVAISAADVNQPAKFAQKNIGRLEFADKVLAQNWLFKVRLRLGLTKYFNFRSGAPVSRTFFVFPACQDEDFNLVRSKVGLAL